MSAAVVVTESPNELTRDIDVCNPIGIVRLLRQTDAQIFTGWRGHEGLYDADTVQSIEWVVERVCGVVGDPVRSAVVMSGCGTSGRIAFLMARSFNARISAKGIPPCYHYIIAGGDQALLKSVEATEDSWKAGVEALEQVARGKEHIVFIGITCGLSAPFVAGQLAHCLENKAVFTPVLLGFNPVHQARHTPIRDWNKTFHDVAMVIIEECKRGGACVLNPVLGPEAITGSTRMKAGSASKLLLETILSLAECRTHSGWRRTGGSSVTDLLQSYELTYRHTYLHVVTMATLMETAGHCLQSGGRVYYLGVGGVGLMAVVDATECMPTFGAAFDDIRGFVRGGYSTLLNREGDLSGLGTDFCLDWDYFVSSVLPQAMSHDCVVFVMQASEYSHVAGEVEGVCGRVRERGCKIACIVVGSAQDNCKVDYSLFDNHVEVLLPWQPLSHYWSCDSHMDYWAFLCEAAVKWVLNAVSTGAHVMIGKVLRNRMIDLQVSNSKLYYRAIGIIQEFSGGDEAIAERSLLSAIHGRDTVDSALLSADLRQHLQAATGKHQVVPVAVLVSTGHYTVQEALAALHENPIVRSVLQQTNKMMSHAYPD